MKQLFDPVISTANDLSRLAKRISEGGLRFLTGKFGDVPVFASVIARQSGQCADRDETHYFLVPYRLSECGYALYTERVLPDSVGPENALPKARIFHLPADGTLLTLEELLLQQLTAKEREQINVDTPVAARLDMIAEEIDKQSDVVTGGLILVGGVIAIANPLLGAGIAAKALLPTLGSKLSKHGINHLSDWLRERKKLSADKDASRIAEKQITRMRPEVHIDETLALLEEALATSDPAFDPALAFASMMNTPDQALAIRQACEAISCVYQNHLDADVFPTEAQLHAPDIHWLRSLAEISAGSESRSSLDR